MKSILVVACSALICEILNTNGALADVPAYVELKDSAALSDAGVVCAPDVTGVPLFPAFPNCAAMPSNSASGNSGAGDGQALLKGGVSSDVHHKSAHASNAGPEHRRLDNGTELISKDYDVVVDTLICPVHISANAVVLILATDKNLVVYNLHDDHKNAVVLEYPSGPIDLIPGQAAVIANQSVKSFEDVNPAPVVYYRHLTQKPLDEHRQLFQAEFNILSLVKGLPPINALINSEDAEARHRMDSMLKTTAIMMQLTNTSDPYALYMTPAVRALAIKSTK
ncbi:MAG: hypothetical protein KGS72_08575 [Cyanobacteria bacterium REEB67]|nr:hypothetical protein [Cyanobacteria bacterium REEB67]